MEWTEREKALIAECLKQAAKGKRSIGNFPLTSPNRILSDELKKLIINSKFNFMPEYASQMLNPAIKEVLEIEKMADVKKEDIPLALKVAKEILAVIENNKKGDK